MKILNGLSRTSDTMEGAFDVIVPERSRLATTSIRRGIPLTRSEIKRTQKIVAAKTGIVPSKKLVKEVAGKPAIPDRSRRISIPRRAIDEGVKKAVVVVDPVTKEAEIVEVKEKKGFFDKLTKTEIAGISIGSLLLAGGVIFGISKLVKG